MLNQHRVAMVSVQWMTIVYLLCAIFVGVFPAASQQLATMTLHMARVTMMEPSFTFPDLIIGLVVWGALAYLGASLFVWLWNRSK